MRKFAAAVFLLSFPAYSQPTAAPTNEPVGIARGENTEEYNVRQSFEVGYRWHAVGGDTDAYRGMVNFGNGIRLLGSSLSVNSREGHGHWFDQIQLSTQGLGNDPYQNALLRFEKNKLYRYDLNWRSSAYYNQGLYNQFLDNASLYQNSGANLLGQHSMDTVRNTQDHDVTFFPQGSLKFFLGFSRNTQRGPALSSAQFFDSRGDEYPLFADVHRQQHEYRAGFELGMLGWRLNLMHGWVNFREDTPTLLLSPSAGSNTFDANTLTTLSRNEPYHGNSPYWRIALFKESRLWVFNGRFTYVTGRRDFVLDESAVGTDRFGASATRQIVTMGNAQRPAAAANATFSVFPSVKLTLTNQTSLNNIRMVGNAAFTQIINGTSLAPFVPFTYLGIRTVSNTTDIDYRPARWFGVRTGYQYSSRLIRSKEVGSGTDSLIEQANGMHTGMLGIRIRPVKPLTINLDAEISRADHPIYPISQRNLQAFRGRVEFRRRALRIAGYARTDYSTNSASLANFASQSRQYGADATWTLSPGFFVDAGYAKLHLNTLSALSFFQELGPNITVATVGRGYYFSNLHTATVNAHFAVHNRVDISLGLSHVQDTGDGRPAAGSFNTDIQTQTAPASKYFFVAQTFPLRFSSPQARASIRINEKLRWNLGYQYYGYSEEFGISQNFRAHTGYSSISWSF